jgi:hypothetical protein
MSKPYKPRGFTRFPEREIARITKAVRKGGGGTVTLDPVTGQYTIQVGNKGEVPTDAINPWNARATNPNRPA